MWSFNFLFGDTRISRGKKKKNGTKVLKALRVLEQQVRSMDEQIKELAGNKQQQDAQESPRALPPPSSQTDESSTAKYKLVIKSDVDKIVHIGHPIVTTEGNGITVAMEDLHGNQVAAGHRLASVKVELVALRDSFNILTVDWTEAIFEESIITPPNDEKYIKNAIFQLINGKSTVHESTTFNKSSRKHPVKLGVRVIEHSGERVLEGVSNSFFVRHWRKGKKIEGESSQGPRIPNSRKKNGREKRRETNDAQVPLANPLPGQDFAGSDTAPATDLAITQEPSQNVVTSNGATDTDKSRRPLDPIDGNSHAYIGGDDQIADNPQFLVGLIIGKIPSVRGSVPEGVDRTALLDKLTQLELNLRNIYPFLHPQGKARNTLELYGCLTVVGETVLQLTIQWALSLHYEGPMKNLFNDLQRLQRDLVGIICQEVLKPLDLLPNEHTGNGTYDQNIHGNSHGTAYRESANSQHNPPFMQDPSAGAHSHPSAQGEMTGGVVENPSATSLRLGGQVLFSSK